MARTERTPKASDVLLPVYVPSSDGATSIEMGKASLKSGVLIIEFKNNLPGVAIQNMIARGVVLGLSFVMVAPDDHNIAAQERLEQQEKDAEDLLLLQNEEVVTPETLLSQDETDLAHLDALQDDGEELTVADILNPEDDPTNNEENN